jgi:hypothetical protein
MNRLSTRLGQLLHTSLTAQQVRVLTFTPGGGFISGIFIPNLDQLEIELGSSIMTWN